MGCFADQSRSKRVHGSACEGDCDLAQGSVKVSCYTDCGGASTLDRQLSACGNFIRRCLTMTLLCTAGDDASPGRD